MKKTAQQQKKVASLIGRGATIQGALRAAGYSESTARKGRAALSRRTKEALAKSLGEGWESLVGSGRVAKADELRAAVVGRLSQNLIEGKDNGAQSAKLLGMLREVDCWKTPEQVGAYIIIEAPRGQTKELPILDAEILPQEPGYLPCASVSPEAHDDPTSEPSPAVPAYDSEEFDRRQKILELERRCCPWPFSAEIDWK